MKTEKIISVPVLQSEETLYYNRVDRALILHLQKLSTEDGPGIRTTVFFKGCPLHCEWCHNPESISFKRQIQWIESRCIGCGLCVDICPYHCLHFDGNTLYRNRDNCRVCGKCAEECPAGAQEILGHEITLEKLMSEIQKDRIYYEKSGGGVTLSGGEPMMQPHFVLNLFRELKHTGINTALDTCGLCSPQSLQQILPYTDIILYDLKEIDPERHREFTGRDNGRILSNLLLIKDYIINHPWLTLWIRTPLIPGATANRKTVEQIGHYIYTNLKDVFQRWELCAFNNLCRDKYRRLNIQWKYSATPLISKEELDTLEKIGKESGPDPARVFATGATKVES